MQDAGSLDLGVHDRRSTPPQDHRSLHSVVQNNSWDDEISEMRAIWPEIVSELTESGTFALLPDATKWMAEALNYNVSRGNKRRYLALVYAYKNLVPADELTEENLRLARMLGWCVEMWLSGCCVLRDIIDNSEKRRNDICWHKRVGIGELAIVDGFNLQNLPFEILRRHFRDKPCYLEMLELFQEITLKLAIGTLSETLGTRLENKPNLDNFTMNLYRKTVLNKTSYTIVMPIHLAMYLAGIKDPEMFKQAEVILLELGQYYQVQNDYRDCFGDPEFKSETDIPAGRLSWPIVIALQGASPEQRKLLDECYGVNDPEKIAKVKQLYNDFGIKKLYEKYEEMSYNLITRYIQQITCGLPQKIFLNFRDNIFSRNAWTNVSGDKK